MEGRARQVLKLRLQDSGRKNIFLLRTGAASIRIGHAIEINSHRVNHRRRWVSEGRAWYILKLQLQNSGPKYTFIYYWEGPYHNWPRDWITRARRYVIIAPMWEIPGNNNTKRKFDRSHWAEGQNDIKLCPKTHCLHSLTPHEPSTNSNPSWWWRQSL